jgi:phosphoglycolate phosphatase-like HAD superfamily hydrolase
MTIVAIELDAVLGDTRPLWRAWLEDLARRSRIEVEDVPDDRTQAGPLLDARVGNWHALLERFAEDYAPVYLRPNAEVSAALRRLEASGATLVAFTDAPEPLTRVALAHLGAARRLDAVVVTPPAHSTVVRSRDELLLQSERWSARH